MWDLICAEEDVLVLEKGGAEEVSERMVFLVECEDRRVRMSAVEHPLDLFLAVAEEEKFEAMEHASAGELRRGTVGCGMSPGGFS